MKILRFDSARSFLTTCEDFLLESEDLYHTILSAAELIASGSNIFEPPFCFVAVMKSDSVAGCCIHVNPDGLLLTKLPTDSIDLVLQSLDRHGPKVRRISGPPGVANRAAEKLTELFSLNAKEEAKWSVYKADDVLTQPKVLGKLRLADHEDEALVKHWGQIYQAEKPAPVSVPAYFQRKISEKNLYIWDNEQPRALVATSTRSARGIKLSAVFTPPEYRQKGYAGAAVSAVCNRLLSEELDFVVLAAIQGAAPEKIYRRLGFYMIGERLSIKLWQKEQF